MSRRPGLVTVSRVSYWRGAERGGVRLAGGASSGLRGPLDVVDEHLHENAVLGSAHAGVVERCC